MATGFIVISRVKKMVFHFTLPLFICLFASAVFAQGVGLAGLLGSKAMLMVDGGELRAGVVV